MEEEFRQEISQWFQNNCPDSMKTPMPAEEQVWASSKIKFPNNDSRKWFKSMVEKGYCTPEWPKKYGGAGLSKEKANVLRDEMRKQNCRNPQINFGITMLGPVILEYGNEEQKREFLPKISQGKIWWCQGFSEPGAGSDLASLSTTATQQENGYVINGSKIWTSEADKADWMYCLAKTDPSKKHEGISFFLVNMKQPGVDVKRIKLLSGVSPFCQVFFDDVFVYKRHCIGGVNNGWNVAKRLLQYERNMMADMKSEGAIDVKPLEIIELSNCLSEERDIIKDEVISHEARNELINLTIQRSIDESTIKASTTGLILKYLSTEEVQERWELNIKALGMGGLMNVDSQEGTRNDIVKSFFYSKAYTIAGGSSEVQLNIISKKLLGLSE